METIYSLTLFDWLFYFFALITIVSAAVVVFSNNIVYSAFSLLFTFFGVAGMYVLLSSDFLGITQLLVYVGGILVLILFGVMLTNRTTNLNVVSTTINRVPSLFIGAALMGTLCGFFWITDWFYGSRSGELTATTTSLDIGNALITTHALPFEIASVILLVALIGAAMIARKDK
jgi:NADH-quinone oxidoreductase subunit J